MADFQAAHLDALVAGKVARGAAPHRPVPARRGRVFARPPRRPVARSTARSEFLTPIVELEFDKVTKREAEFYERWRQGYENNWSTFFDPIAIRFHASRDKLAADLTVMPLIDFSQYRELVAISRRRSSTKTRATRTPSRSCTPCWPWTQIPTRST